MFTAICSDSNEKIKIKPSKISSLQPSLDENITFVKFFGNRKSVVKGSFYIEKSLQMICDEIKAMNGDLEKLGEFHFFDYNDSHRPQISLLRQADSTKHQSFCLKCGFVKQVYHSQICDCKIHRVFDGVMKDNALTKQIVILSEDSLNAIDSFDVSGISFNELDDHILNNRTVKNIKIENGEATGEITFKGFVIPVVSSSDFNNGLEPKKSVWYS